MNKIGDCVDKTALKSLMEQIFAIHAEQLATGNGNGIGYLAECIALIDQALDISVWLSKLDIHARGVERSVCVFTVWALDGRKASTRRGKGLNLKGFCSTLRSIEKGTFDHEAPSI